MMRLLNAFTSIFLALGLSACSISDRWVHEDSEGVVSDTFFSSVKSNKTNKTWLVENLGEPHSTVMGPNGEEIVSYRFKRTRYRTASLLVVMRYDGSIQDSEHYHVMYCHDIVKKAWWDMMPEVQVARVTRRSKCSADKPKMKDTALDTVDMNKAELSAPADEIHSAEKMMNKGQPVMNKHADAAATEPS